MTEQDRRISEAVSREQSRLHNFIRKRVADPTDAEDDLAGRIHELVEAYRMMKPLEQVTAWLFQVARNRITDMFRRKARTRSKDEEVSGDENGETHLLKDMLPSRDGGPEAAYVRSVSVNTLLSRKRYAVLHLRGRLRAIYDEFSRI